MGMTGTSTEAEATSRLVIVAGSGRSGTSTISGVLSTLGLHIPQPEVPGGPANPRGHFEPQWVVDFQQRLLVRSRVRLADPRPDAFDRAGELGVRPGVQEQLLAWLRPQLAIAPEIVVKDPRNSWFLPMWRAAAQTLDVSPRYLTMLRHPAEVLGSKNSYYHKPMSAEERRSGDTSRLAGWINVALFTELPTRPESRAFVRYTDLVSDWRTAVAGVVKTLDLSPQNGIADDAAAAVDAFIDPDLHRVKVTWADVDAPVALQDLAEEVWRQLNVLADSAGHDPGAEAALDAARDQYAQLYADAFALTSVAVASEVQDALAKAKTEEPPPTPSRPARSLPRRLASRGRRTLRRLRRT